MNRRGLWSAWILVSLALAAPGVGVEPPPAWAILPEAQGRLFVRGTEPTWTPTVAQIREAEARLPEYLRRQGHAKAAADLGWHLRQYAGFTRQGKRLVYLNAIDARVVDLVTCKSQQIFPRRIQCRPADYWRHEAVEVFDGGDDFWHVEYDPGTRRFAGLQFNGVA